MSRQYIVTVGAILLILVSICIRLGTSRDNRAGSTLIITDLVENKEYIVFSPIITTFTKMETEEGIQRMLIAENSKELSEIRSFTLDSKNVNKEDYDKLTYGSKLIRRGNTIKIIEPPSEQLPDNKMIVVEEEKKT